MEIRGIASYRGVQTVKPSGVDALFSILTKESVKSRRVADDG
jgi:hypothetical protein